LWKQDGELQLLQWLWINLRQDELFPEAQIMAEGALVQCNLEHPTDRGFGVQM